MSLYVQVPIQQIADGLTAIGWSSGGGGGDASLTYSATAPASPINGTLWWDTTNTLLKIYTGGVWTTVNVSAETIASISTSVSQAQSAATSASNSASQALAAKNAITGMQVATGAAGSSVTWDGTTLTVPQGIQGTKGDQGVSISGIARTTGDGSAGTTDTYTIYYSDATTGSFEVYNGANGAVMSVAGKTGDVVLTTLDIGGLNEALASVETALVVKPTIIAPVSGVENYIGAITTTYVTASSYTGEQDYAKWECATDVSFNTIIDSYEGNANLLSWTPSIGLALTTVYVRVKQGSDKHRSVWSNSISFTTPSILVQNPSLTVTGTPSSVPETPTLTTSAFSVYNGTDTHVSTDYEVLLASDNSVVWQSLANSANKLSMVVPAGKLLVSTAYKFRVRHNGTTYGSSGWVEVLGTTKSAFTIPIGTAGAIGFGVAPSSEPFALLGLSEMTGTTDVNSDNYGNYQHTNGSIMVHVPKFYYRVGNASAPQYATYGANSLEIAGTDTFTDETTANAAGYALHRAFIDSGAVKGGFFIDKYMASKKSGDANVAVSIKNGNPIGLTTNATYTPSSTMTGCTGILADAVTLSRARGSYFNTASVFMYGALALLSVAHGQKATSTTGCAWYDASRTMNFPKGCNNGSRADVNDTSVTWSASPDTAAKGLTGSASTFAKSTHNGQNNGIADLNGLMYEVALGMTNIGTSAIDTAQISSNIIYLLKQSVALKSLTAGWDGTLDAWGNSTHLATLYDQVTSPIDITNTGAFYWGSGNNAVFSSELSGVGRDICGFLPKDNNAYDATGTNMCGGDYMYRYNRSNMFPYVSGGWSYAAFAGVFFRLLNGYRSSGNYDVGFRVSAYV